MQPLLGVYWPERAPGAARSAPDAPLTRTVEALPPWLVELPAVASLGGHARGPGGRRARAARQLARADCVTYAHSSSPTTASMKAIWPNAIAVPRLAAPAASAIAVARANAPPDIASWRTTGRSIKTRAPPPGWAAGLVPDWLLLQED